MWTCAFLGCVFMWAHVCALECVQGHVCMPVVMCVHVGVRVAMCVHVCACRYVYTWEYVCMCVH